jgi:hypothetical protein
VHGDLTPGNVLLTTSSRDARRWVCKVRRGPPQKFQCLESILLRFKR